MDMTVVFTAILDAILKVATYKLFSLGTTLFFFEVIRRDTQQRATYQGHKEYEGTRG